MAKKPSKGGRPPKYEGEKPVRIGALIRPRYKEMLEIISQDRGSTLGEALEYVISSASLNYYIGGELVYNLVVQDEDVQEMINSCLRDDDERLEPSEGMLEDIENFEKNSNRYNSLPMSLRSPYLDFLNCIGSHCGAVLWFFYDKTKLLEVVNELWKRGVSSADVLDMILKNIPQEKDEDTDYMFPIQVKELLKD